MAITAVAETARRATGAPYAGRRPSAARRRRTQGSSVRTNADVPRLLRAYHRDGDLGARARLIQQYLPLVRRLARRYVGHGEQFEDLVQVGSIGLIKAIDRFQLERGVDLASYAIPTIDGEIKRHLRDRAWPIRIPQGYELGEDRIALARGFHVLDARERLLLRFAYFDGLSQAQIARRVGISQIHVSRLTRRALAKLRAAIGHPDP
jgi:RNA polymerase sigma factor (sigma-70 family)